MLVVIWTIPLPARPGSFRSVHEQPVSRWQREGKGGNREHTQDLSGSVPIFGVSKPKLAHAVLTLSDEDGDDNGNGGGGKRTDNGKHALLASEQQHGARRAGHLFYAGTKGDLVDIRQDMWLLSVVFLLSLNNELQALEN